VFWAYRACTNGRKRKDRASAWTRDASCRDYQRRKHRTAVADVSVLRPEVDSGGYDLALEYRGIVRHVQLKSSHRHAKRASITANVRLLDRSSACILWIYFDPNTLLLGPFFWFGGAPGEKIPALGEKVATHTKHNAQGVKSARPGHRVIPKSSFTKLDTIDEVVQRLFGVAGWTKGTKR
jgi:hypothetical protein